MRTSLRTWLLLAAAGLLVACGGDDSSPTPDTDAIEEPDTFEDTIEEPDTDAESDTEQDPEADTDDPSDERPFEPGAACTFQEDCESDESCLDGACYPQRTCRNVGTWGECVNAYSEVDPDAANRATCTERRCVVGCWQDQHCPENHACTDWGQCRPFDGVLGAYPPDRGARAPLQAGVGSALQNFPIGLPLGGYGSRSDGTPARFGVSLRDSFGASHALRVHALALDTGDSKLMVIRVPLIFTGSDIHEQVARNLQAETGEDWRDGLIISSTHTHSGPGRHWPLPPDPNLPIGALGIGEYSPLARQWVIESITEAAIAAVGDLSPARLGWQIIEAFDTDDAIASDRWSETPPFDDNRILLMRVDDADGVPRAAVVSFGMHPTVNSQDYATDDVIYSVESVLEDHLSSIAGRNVPAMFVNQNSGTMSPRTGNQPYPFSLQRTGHVLWERIGEQLLDMETSDDIALRTRGYAYPINFDLLNYREEAELWRATSASFPLGGPLLTGAIQCAIPNPEPPDFERRFAQSCVSMRFLLQNRAPTIFMHSMIHAIEIDGLSILTAPGELSMELSWQMLRELRDRFGVDPLQAWTWGYANAHHLYLPPTDLRGELPPFPGISTPQAPDEYPPFAFSWWAGGYEAQMNIWGWKIGDYIVERAMDAWDRLEGNEPRVPAQFPLVFTDVEQEPWQMDATPADRMGNIVVDVPETVERYQPVDFIWVGGDPQAEMPQVPLVTLERLVDDVWTDIIRVNGRPYTNREMLFKTRKRFQDDVWQWAVRWEELHDFPLGTYRFRVEGHAFTTENDRSSRVPYQVTSRTFTLEPTRIEVADVTYQGDTLEAVLTYPVLEAFNFVDTRTNSPDRGAFTGHFRLRDLRIRPGQGRPVDPRVDDEGDLDLDSIALMPDDESEPILPLDISLTVDASGSAPVSRLAITWPEGTASTPGTIALVDAFGNEATLSWPAP